MYQAVWANTTDFDEVLISPVMIQDHMPDNVLEALNKVLNETFCMNFDSVYLSHFLYFSVNFCFIQKWIVIVLVKYYHIK